MKVEHFLSTLAAVAAAAGAASAEQGDESVKELAAVLHTQADHWRTQHNQSLPMKCLY